jgi:UbiD family decarboxylase
MAFQDLREYLEALEKEGQLIRFTDEVWPEPDIRSISHLAGDLGAHSPGVLIENIKGYQGKKVAENLHGGRANLAIIARARPKNNPLGKNSLLEWAIERWR